MHRARISLQPGSAGGTAATKRCRIESVLSFQHQGPGYWCCCGTGAMCHISNMMPLALDQAPSFIPKICLSLPAAEQLQPAYGKKLAPSTVRATSGGYQRTLFNSVPRGMPCIRKPAVSVILDQGRVWRSKSTGRVLHSLYTLSPGYQLSEVKQVRLTEVAQLEPPQAASYEDDEGRHQSFADLKTQVAVLWVRMAPHLHSGSEVCKSSARPHRIHSLPSLSPSLS